MSATSAWISPSCNRCRINTSSYSSTSGTDTWMSNCPVPTSDMSFEEAPRCERCAAMSTLVSMTTCGVFIVVSADRTFQGRHLTNFLGQATLTDHHARPQSPHQFWQPPYNLFVPCRILRNQIDTPNSKRSPSP